MSHRIVLVDDGTLDTVVRCADCGAELRYNYSESDSGIEHQHLSYADFVKECIEDMERDHDCFVEE